MGISSSCPKTKSNPKEAAGTVSIVEGSKRYTVGSAVTGTGVDDYGAKYRFPLRKEPTIRFIATSFRAARHHNTRIIFWVDSNQTQENADLTLHLQARGITIERHFTTASALTSLRTNKSYQVFTPSIFRVVTNRARDGNDNAWYELAKESRSIGYNGPILLFHSAAGASKINHELAKDLNVVPTSDPAHARAYMEFSVSHVNTRFPVDHMFTDFNFLRTEGVGSRVVEGTAAEVLEVFEQQCTRLNIQPAARSVMHHDLMQFGRYTKHYLPRSCIDVSNRTYASCIFRHVESLVMQFTAELRCDASLHQPRVERVIVVENPHLKDRFTRALLAKEATAAANPKAFQYPQGDDKLMDILRMQLPDIPSHPNARPCLVFHATSDRAEKLISAIGFRKEFMASASGLQKFGAGIYFSTFPMYCSSYQKDPREATGAQGAICFLASWVLLGHPFLKKCAETSNGRSCGLQDGYDSHYALVRQGNSIFDPATGEVFEDERGMPDGDEIVIFEPDHILPQFVIEMNMV